MGLRGLRNFRSPSKKLATYQGTLGESRCQTWDRPAMWMTGRLCNMAATAMLPKGLKFRLWLILSIL